MIHLNILSDDSQNLNMNMSESFVVTDTVVDDELSPTSENPVQNKVVTAALNDKVDKEAGKGLSENDYTTEDKAKLAGIEAGAQVNPQIDASMSSTSTNAVQNKVVNSALGNKVDKVDGKGLSSNDYTNAEKNKLAGIETGAQKNTPVDTALSDSSTNPVQNKVIKTALDGKVNAVSGKGLSTNDFTTQDKNKLDGIQAGAEVNPTDISAFNNDEGYIREEEIDDHMSSTSPLPVENRVITQAIADNRGRVFYGTVDPTSTATAFTATIPGITAYDEGLTVILKNGVVTSTTNFTININGLGALPVYTNLAAESRDTGIFNISYTMMFVYENRVSGGDWLCYRGYYENDVGYQIRTSAQTLPMDSVTYRYRLLFTSADKEHFVPANNSSSTSSTEAKEVCQNPIDPWGAIYYYNSTSSVSAGSRPSAASLWEQCTLPLGYSFNKTGQALTLTPYKPVYLQCWSIQDGHAAAVINTTEPYVQDLPNYANGAIYIFLGVANSATNIELALNHPVYKFDNGRIRPYVDDSDLITNDDLQLAFDTPYFMATDASSKGVMELAFGFEVQIVVPSDIGDINDLINLVDPRNWYCWLNGTELEFGRMSVSFDTSTLAATVYMKGRNSMASGIMGVDDAWTIT